MTFDEMRQNFPTFGFAVYAMEPGKDVTLEVHTPTDFFTFKGDTEQAAIDRAFPPAAPETEEPVTTTAFD